MNKFIKAKPVWVLGKEKEVNCRVQFKAICPNTEKTLIRIATSGVYQLIINGKFVSYGPARAGKDHFRQENVDISAYLDKKENVIVIEVAGYYCNNFYVMRQESFLMAEIVCGNNCISATGYDFTARINPFYKRKIQRYSFQRTFAESYEITDINDSYLYDSSEGNEEISVLDNKIIISRTVPYPEYEIINAEYLMGGKVEKIIPDEYKYDRYFTKVGFGNNETTGWQPEELLSVPEKDWQEMKFIGDKEISSVLKEKRYFIYEFGHNSTGLINLNINCKSKVILYLLFDEILTDEVVNPKRTRSCDIIKYTLPEGRHSLRTFEIYTLKYLQIVALSGECIIDEISIIEYKHPFIKAPEFEDYKLRKIAQAAVETYRQNAVDLFTDCPSRERAGWLCDSFFLGRTEYALTGKNIVEEAFLENFLHTDNYENLPNGMVPMCYPADHWDGTFIPNWALWLIVEISEYKKRGGKKELIERYKNKVYGILDYFKSFENSDGLLENLESWVFVEWSRANDKDMISGVNYPSNMLYYAANNAVSELYGDISLKEKAEKIKNAINNQAFDGEFYIDHSIRENGEIKPVSESTEVCQYYAFFSGVATKETHLKLYNTMINEFGPNRDTEKVYPDIYKAAPFIGNYLRLEIMKNGGYDDAVRENIKDYFYYMAEKTGTLWEKAETTASCNHGFASCVLYWMI